MKMKKMIFLMLLSFLGITASMNAQVAIGTGTGVDGAPVAGAVLELDGTKGALLLPKVDALATIASPAAGMLVYLKSDNQVYIYDGTSWNVYTGAEGPAGAKGDTGSQGPKGDTGATGAAGTNGAQGPKGDTGATGAAGTNGAKGDKGDTGATGAAGKGISTTVINYATSASGTTTPTSGWGTSIPSVAAGQYLWTRTVITYTDATNSTVYSIGMKGETGATGPTDFTSVIMPEYFWSTASTAGASWQDAKAACAALDPAGYYRLPTAIELRMAAQSSLKSGFPTSVTAGYWCADANNGLRAFTVNINTGNIGAATYGTKYVYRCILGKL
ncbi:hypothetical protein FACS189421_00110 [Bacteroidia bacterium]|nr:hypothetical protein FACS189421_00110 [Bacteroidia bacterium]GHT50872.1 hypothetical protein FACS189440_19050 [Bacteroidia bacterium]